LIYYLGLSWSGMYSFAHPEATWVDEL